MLDIDLNTPTPEQQFYQTLLDRLDSIHALLENLPRAIAETLSRKELRLRRDPNSSQQ